MKDKYISWIKKLIFNINLITLLFVVIITICFISGIKGNINLEKLNDLAYVTSPFENSSPRSRFALTYSIAENKTAVLSKELAIFSLPDVAKSNNNYVSLFAPGVSLLVLPGYMLGKILGFSQLGTFAVIGIFTLLNFLLIRRISFELTNNMVASNLGGLTYILATPSLAYSGTLYQHQITVFIVLAALYSLFKLQEKYALAIVWFLSALSILVDYPNIFFMAPIGFFALNKFFKIEKDKKNELTILFKYPLVLTFLTTILPVCVFLSYNYLTFGNIFQLSGTLQRITSIDTTNIQVTNDNGITVKKDKNAVGFFKTRSITNGLYTHFLSPDRGIINYTPVMMIALIGLFVVYKDYKNNSLYKLILLISGIVILLYSMWGDPWGGWAFGSRYLIPVYALFSILIAILLNKYQKNIVVLVVFMVLFIRSVNVNVIGAATSLNIPPKSEVLELEKLSGKEEKYTVARNYLYIANNQSRTYLYNELLRSRVSLQSYINIIVYASSILGFLLIIKLYDFRKKK